MTDEACAALALATMAAACLAPLPSPAIPPGRSVCACRDPNCILDGCRRMRVALRPNQTPAEDRAR
jgi:hypothetical protein